MSKLFVFVLMFGVVMCRGRHFKLFNVEPCGVEASKALIHHNPWLVYLEYYRRDRLTEIRCAATLITSRHLLTAAHCTKIRYSKLVARLGEYDTSSKKDCSHGVCADPLLRVEVAAVYVHPGYGDRQHDIAVLQLAQDAPYTDFIRPVCLPTGSLPSEVTFIAAGWGVIPSLGEYSVVKKIITLPNFPLEKCRNVYQTYFPDHVICAGGVEGQDTCRGDSGGPLVRVKCAVELWGVTSAGSNQCGMADIPGIYTSVEAHLEWIMSVIT